MSSVVRQFEGQYRFLSNFYPCRVPVDISGNVTMAPSVEHAYQAMKSDDPIEQKKIIMADTPGKAKRLGKKVKLREGWEESKLEVMKLLLRFKFSKGSRLSFLLLGTGDDILEEGNSWGDTFWGISPPRSGNGENHLGKILMEIRDELDPAKGEPNVR